MKAHAETATIMVKDASQFNVVERSIWHLNKMYKTLPMWNPKRAVEINENLSLLTLSSSAKHERPVLSPQTQLNFVYRKYRFVVSIDTSMSLFATDITTGLPLFSSISQKLHCMFLEIVRAVYIPNTEIVFSPEIFVSVVAQGTHPNPIVVLVQAFKLSAQNLPALLKILENRLRDLEDKIVNTLKATDAGVANVSEDLSNALRNAALALKFLPKDACPVLVVLTDGVLGPPSRMGEYDNLVTDFNRHGIPINILQLGQNLDYSTLPFGFLDNTKSLHWMCTATGGTMLSLPKMNRQQLDASWYSTVDKISKQPPNKIMFCLLWRFSHVSTSLKTSKRRYPDLRRGELGRFGPRDAKRTLYKELISDETSDWLTLKREADRAIRVEHNFPWSGRFAPPVPVCTRVVLQYKLSGYVESHDIMMCRVLEGFQVKTLSTAADLNHRNNIKGFVPPEEGSKCHLVSQCKLEYPWQPDVRIQYTFCIWWIVRRAQQKRVRVITVQISATAPVDILRAAIEFAQPARKRDSNTTNAWSDSASNTLTQFLKEIRYNDNVLDRMKQACLFNLPHTYNSILAPTSSSSSSSNERHIDVDSNDVASFLLFIGSLNLKLWHRWFIVEHFEVLYSVGSVENHLLHHYEKHHHEPCNLEMHKARANSKSLLRDTLKKWCTTRLGDDVFMHYFTTITKKTTTDDDTTTTNEDMDNKTTEPPPGVLYGGAEGINFREKTRHQRRGAFCLVRLEWSSSSQVITVHVAFLACKPAARETTIQYLRSLIGSSSKKTLRLIPLKTPILRLLAAPHCDDFSVESLTTAVSGREHQSNSKPVESQKRNRFSQGLELRSLQHEEESRSTALPANPCCGGTGPSPETLMSYLRGTRWTYRNLTLVAARTSFRGIVAARERQGFVMLFFGKDCAVLVRDMAAKQRNDDFEIPFQYAVSIAKVEDMFELRFAIWTQALDNKTHLESTTELQHVVIRTDCRIVGVARFMDRVEDSSLWMSSSSSQQQQQQQLEVIDGTSYCDAEIIRFKNVRCEVEELTQGHTGIETVQCLPVLVQESNIMENRLYDMLINSLIDLSNCEIESIKTFRTFAISIDSCSLMLIMIHSSPNEENAYLKLRFRFVTFASVVRSLVDKSDEVLSKHTQQRRSLLSIRRRSLSVSQKSMLNSKAQIRHQVQSELKDTICQAHFQNMIHVLYYSVRYFSSSSSYCDSSTARLFLDAGEMFDVNFDLDITRWLSSRIFDYLDASDRIEMNRDIHRVISKSLRIFDSNIDEWFVYASNVVKNEEEDLTLPMFLQLKIFAYAESSPLPVAASTTSLRSNEDTRSVGSHKTSTSSSNKTSGISIPVRFSGGICAAIQQARFAVETKRKISMEISSNLVRNLLSPIEEEGDLSTKKDDLDIQWRSRSMSPVSVNESEVSSDLDIKISVCIPRTENVSAQFNRIQMYLTNQEEDEPVSDGGLNKSWSQQLDSVRILRKNITDVISSYFLRLMSVSKIQDVLSRREEVMLHLNRSKDCDRRKISVRFVYSLRSFDLDSVVSDIVSNAREISDIVECVTSRSILLRSKLQDKNIIVWTSIVIRSDEICISVHSSRHKNKKNNALCVLRHGLIRWRKRNVTRAFEMWRHFVDPSYENFISRTFSGDISDDNILRKKEDSISRQEFLEIMSKIVRESIHKVNQKLLLRNMYDTQQISRLLRVSFTTTSSVSSSTTTTTSNALFPAGYFACKLQRETKFKVHFRLQAIVALNAVTRGIMLPFLLRYVDMKSESRLLNPKSVEGNVSKSNNNEYMFFYRDRKSQVMYLTLSVVNEDNHLCLRAFGLGNPFEQDIQALEQRIRDRLDIINIQNLESTIMSNSSTTLSKEDLLFMMNDERSEQSEILLALPAEVLVRPWRFLHLFKQSAQRIMKPIRKFESSVQDIFSEHVWNCMLRPLVISDLILRWPGRKRAGSRTEVTKTRKEIRFCHPASMGVLPCLSSSSSSSSQEETSTKEEHDNDRSAAIYLAQVVSPAFPGFQTLVTNVSSKRRIVYRHLAFSDTAHMYSNRNTRSEESTTPLSSTISNALGLGIVRTEFVEIDCDGETCLRPIAWIPVQIGSRGQGDAGMLQDQAAENETLRSKQYAFGIQVWGRSIHTKILLQRVVACVREALCDYFVDATMRLPREDHDNDVRKTEIPFRLRSNSNIDSYRIQSWLKKLWSQMHRAAEGQTNSDAIVRQVSWQNISLPSWSLRTLNAQIARAVRDKLPDLSDSLRTIQTNRLKNGIVMDFIHSAKCLEVNRATKQRSDFETVFDSREENIERIIDLSTMRKDFEEQQWKWSRVCGILIRLIPSSSTVSSSSTTTPKEEDSLISPSGLEFRAYNIAARPANELVTLLDKHLFWQHARSHMAVQIFHQKLRLFFHHTTIITWDKKVSSYSGIRGSKRMNVPLTMKNTNAFKFQTSNEALEYSKTTEKTTKTKKNSRGVKVFSRMIKQHGFSTKDRMRERMMARRAAFLGHEKIPKHVVKNTTTTSSSSSSFETANTDSPSNRKTTTTTTREFNEALLNVPSFMFRRFDVGDRIADPVKRHTTEFLDIVKAQTETHNRNKTCVESALDLYDRRRQGFIDPGSLTAREATDLLDIARFVHIKTFPREDSIDSYVSGLEDRLRYATVYRTSRDDVDDHDEEFLMMQKRGSFFIVLRLSHAGENEICCEWYVIHKSDPCRELSSVKFMNIFWECEYVDFGKLLLD